MELRTIADIAATVRGRRVERGWTQADLAARVGVSRKWLVDLEGGKASVQVGLLLRVLDALDIALVTATTRPQPRPSSELDDLLEEYRRG